MASSDVESSAVDSESVSFSKALFGDDDSIAKRPHRRHLWRRIITPGNVVVLCFGLAGVVVLVTLSQTSKFYRDLEWEAWYVMTVILLTFMAMLKDFPPDIVMMTATAFLVLSRVLGPYPSVADWQKGWSSSGPLTVGVMYMVAKGLEESRVLELFSRYLLGKPRNYFWAMFKMLIVQAFISTWWNNTPQVAMMIPVLEQWGRRIKIPSSKLLLPLSYATIIGNLSLIATSSNLVATGLATARGLPDLGFLNQAAVTLVSSLVGCVYITFASYFLLPAHNDVAASVIANPRDYTVSARVSKTAPIVGKSIQDAGLRSLQQGLFLISIQRDSGELISAPSHDVAINAGDLLMFAGLVDNITSLYTAIDGLEPVAAQQISKLRTSSSRALVEAVIAPHSPLIGKTIKGCRFRTHFNAAVIAVHRSGQHVLEVLGDIVLHPGDTLLLEADRGFAKQWRNHAAFSLVADVPTSSSSPAAGLTWLSYAKMAYVLVLLAGLVAVAGAQKVDVFTLAVWLVLLYLAARIMTIEQAYAAINVRVVTLIASSLGLSVAFSTTGAASALALQMIDVLRPLGHLGIIAALYGTTAVLSNIINPTPAVSLMFPVAYAMYQARAVTHLQFMYAIMFGASDVYSTPYAYQTNVMVQGPGGYSFKHYVMLGLPLQFLVGTINVLLIYLIF